MATQEHSAYNPARPNESTPAGPINDTALEAAVTEAGEHPERADALAKDLGVGEGRWFSPADMAELRRVFVLSGQHPDDSPLASVVFGPSDEDHDKEDYSGDDCIRAGELAPLTGSGQHEALMYLRQWRELHGATDGNFPYADMVLEHFTLLTHSPAYRAFLEDALAPVKRIRDKNWKIAWFGAEMFAAGLLTARREFGRRPAMPYDLELDQVTQMAVPFEEVPLMQHGARWMSEKGGAR